MERRPVAQSNADQDLGSGGELLATPDLERMERAIAQLSPEDARGFHRFFCDNRNKLQKFTPFLEQPFESWRDLAKLDMLKLLPLLRPWHSLDSDLKQVASLRADGLKVDVEISLAAAVLEAG